MFSQARFLPAAKRSGRNNEVTVRRGFTVICILKQDIPQKIFKFVDRCLRPTGRIPWIILRPWGFSCVRDTGHRGSKITESFGATISGIVWVAKCYIWLDSGCPEYGRPIKTNAFTLKLSQKSLRRKLVGRKNDYKTLHRSHKFDTQNSPTVVTRIDTPKSGCYLHSKYIMGVKDKKENIRWYVGLERVSFDV